MRKLKLLFAAATLIFGGGILTANAQASYNHTYTEGATVAAGGDYFLYNIGAGQFLTSGLNYGTRATVDNSGRVLTLAAATNGYSIYTNYVSLNNRTDAKAGYLTTNGYVDTGTNDADWVFTPVNIDGYTNAYTIKNSDTQYLFFDVENTDPGCPVNVGNNTGNNYSYWLLIPKATREAASDYSHYIINTQMNCAWEWKTWGGSTEWNDNAIVTPGGLVSNRCGEKYHTIVDIYQDIKQTVPNGRYRLFAQGFYRQDDNLSQAAPVLYANNNTENILVKTGSENSMNDASTSFTAGNYVNAVETFVNDGSLRVGINITGDKQWVIFDNFVLDYLGQCVMDYAVALPEGGAMEANTWYYFDITAAADNYNATATTLGDIICTTDGYTLTSATSGTVTLTAENNSLSAQRYYVRSSSANNLAINVASYTYSISEATADMSYVQTGNTVTVNYTVSSNDPAATLTQDYSGVTFDGEAITVAPTANGFAFTVPTVTADTNHELSIPAGAIKYNADNQNAAQSITLKAPSLFDGTYFLKVAATYDGTTEGTSAAVGKYMARGTAYGTHLSLDSYGLPVTVTTDGGNVSTLKMADTNAYVFSTGSYDAYADGSSSTGFTFSIQNSKYLIASNNRGEGKYLKYNTANASDEEISVFDDGTGTNNGPIILWAVESISDHATAMQAKKDSQAATAAAAAYASGNYASLNGITTVSALETELTANYIEGQFVIPSEITSVQESYQPRNNNAANLVPVTVYSNTINITEAGFYKFSMQAFNRTTWNENVQALHTMGADMPAAVLFFGDSETQIKSLYDEVGHDTAVEGANPADASYNGKYYANCMTSALKMFKDDKYHNDVWFYCATPGTYTYGVKVMGYAGGQWFIYSPESVTITSYAAAADANDYAALNNAINAYDAATWGFEANEYAPYNNVEAIANIATAKAIDQTATNSKLLVNSMTAKLALTANTTEVNAVYDGDFAIQPEHTTGPTALTGWNNPEGIRQIIKNTETYAGLNSASANAAVFAWGNTTMTYGNTEGYTMPLAAHTIYELSFKTCGWADGDMGYVNVTVLNSANEGMTQQTTATATKRIGAENPWDEFKIVFATGEAGNYTLGMWTSKHTVFTDIVLKKAASQELVFADNAEMPKYAPGTYPAVKISRTLTADRWATAVYPFAVSGVDNIAELDSYTASTGELKFKTATESTANVPFLMRSTAGATEISLSNVEVAAAAAQNAVASEAKLIGEYTQTEITNVEKNYVLSNNNIYSVGTAGATINPYRAYIQVDQPATGQARSLSFTVDGVTTTAIEGLSNDSVENGNVYNLQGQRVQNAQKGLFIQNGKKVVLK